MDTVYRVNSNRAIQQCYKTFVVTNAVLKYFLE